MPGRFSKLHSFLTPKRRWLQFSLGTMLLAVTLLCMWLGDYVSPVRDPKKLVPILLALSFKRPTEVGWLTSESVFVG